MNLRTLTRGAFALALALPLAATAHKLWLLPSATNVAGPDPWVTVDAAASDGLFYPDHVPARLDWLTITAPDGQTAKPENALTGKYRSTFDLHLTQPGTYRLALLNQGVFASYELNGEKKRWRGDAAALAGAIPAGAQHVEVSEMLARVETFVTNVKPSDGALKPSGRGLELVPVTRPTDLVAGEAASFRLLLDGKPAAGLKVVAIAGATRYRNAPEQQEATTGADGRFSLTWAHPGMYWISASTQDGKTQVKQANQRRLSYAATLEVLPE